MMPGTSRCLECGAELPTGDTEGLCPKCLLGAGLDSQGDSAESVAGQSLAATTPRSASFEPPEPAALAPHFPQLEIEALLGQGGMGAVYKARQTKLDRPVALKVIKPESAADPAFAERFHREARTLARLNHPNIVAVHEFGEAGALYYFIMEYVDGASLRQLLQTEELQPEQALAVVPQICEALQFAHDEGIVHRDIKPENILLDRKGRVKIADFGLAKLTAGSQEDYTLTGTHQVMGTPRYMAPEQMEGSHGVDHRADIYSVGVVFYEMLTGEVPAGHFEPPSRKVKIDVRLDEIVLRALAQEPQRRYQQASEVKTDVETVSRGGTAVQPADGARETSAAAGAAAGTPVTSGPGERSAAGTPASYAEATAGDGWKTMVLLVSCFGAVAGVGAMFWPWSEVRIEMLVEYVGSNMPRGHVETVKAAGYHHMLPILAGLLSLALFVVTLVKSAIGEFPSATRGLLAAGAGLSLILCALFVFSVAPLTNHPDEYNTLLRRIGRVEPRNAMYTLRQMDRNHGSIDLRVEVGAGCFVAAFFGMALIGSGAVELRLLLVPALARREADAAELIRRPAAALRWTAWIGLVMVPVLIVMNISYAITASGTVPAIWLALMILLVLQIVQALLVMPLVLIGAMRMQALLSRRLAMAASILAMLPLGLTFVVGAPAGMWSLVILSRPEIVRAFRERTVDKDRAERQLRRAATWLHVMALLSLIFYLLLWMGNLIAAWLDPPPDWYLIIPVISLVVFGPPIVLSVLQSIGARKLWRRASARWGVAAAVIALIPFTPLWVVGLPLGVWTLAVLGQRPAGERPSKPMR